jgi:predicted transposase YbfD/YdcC
MKLYELLRQVPDPRGKQGQDYALWSILSLIVVSLLCGRRGLMAAFRLGRGLTPAQRRALGFMKGTTPCHATLTETVRAIEASALAAVLGAAGIAAGNDDRHVAIDGKTLRASKDEDGKTVHVLSAFCCGLQKMLGQTASRGQGFEIPDALKLLDELDLTGKLVTGDAIFCQKSTTTTIVERGGDYIFPVKDNQKGLRENIEMAFEEPVLPVTRYESGTEKAHGRIEQRSIDVLPAEAAGIKDEWPTVRQICRVCRSRQIKKKGRWQETKETVYLITSLPPASATPHAILQANRGHWGIEIMHRNKDVLLGEDQYTNRSDNAPANIFSLTSLVLTICKTIRPSVIRAIEYFQDDKNRAIRLIQ